MIQRHNEGPWAILTAFVSQALSWFLHVNWIGVIGLCVSAGWLAIGAIRLKWEADDRKAKRAPTGNTVATTSATTPTPREATKP